MTVSDYNVCISPSTSFIVTEPLETLSIFKILFRFIIIALLLQLINTVL